MEPAYGSAMTEESVSEPFRKRWQSIAELFSGPPLDASIFRQRVRFVERNIGIWVKVALAPVIFWFLFSPNTFASLTAPREDVLNYLRNYTLIMTAITVGYGIVLWGMDEIATRILERVVYIVAVLDVAFLAAVTLFCGGFDSILYWVFLGLVIRNAAVIPNPEVQVLVNLTSCACYVLSGVLDLSLTRIENVVLDSYTPGIVASENNPDGGGEPFEALVLRELLLLLMTAVCLGLQVLLDRQRQREAEAHEFALKQDQLEAAGRLAAEIAHQLKNPLGIINNAAYTLHKTVREGKTITQQISIIREEVARSDRIITDLMGYARLAEGRVERVGLGEILDQSILVALPPGSGFQVRIHRDLMEPLPSLLGQRGHFLEIFTNLLVNAREAMNGNGEIWISARATPDYSVLVTVRDSGPGIPPEEIGRVWEAYFTTKDRGTGLGLAIVKHNTEMYGGRVRLESEVGRGATFSITLPARTLMRLR
jgi:signal transduction histidine kinase